VSGADRRRPGDRRRLRARPDSGGRRRAALPGPGRRGLPALRRRGHHRHL